jgi:hypothetical protein
MLLQASAPIAGLVRSVFAELLRSVLDALPRLLAGLVFLGVAYLGIKVLGVAYLGIKAILVVLHGVLDRAYPADQDMIVDLTVVVVGGLLWFGTVLVLLKLVGMSEIAASLGTATGFIALGIAFALKEMIADTVAGV